MYHFFLIVHAPPLKTLHRLSTFTLHIKAILPLLSLPTLITTTLTITMSTLAVGDTFTSMKEAKLLITAALKDDGQSYWTFQSRPTLLVLKCKTTKGQGEGDMLNCDFQV